MGALALVAGALVPTLVVTTAPVAQAATVGTAGLTVAARAAAPAAATACISGGPITAAVCGVGLAALLGAGIYVTRDTWMPWFGIGAGDAQEPRPGSRELNTLSWSPSPSLDAARNVYVMDITVTFNDRCCGFGPLPTYTEIRTTCVSSNGAFNTFPRYIDFAPNEARVVEQSIDVCAPGQVPAQVSVIPRDGLDESTVNRLWWTGDRGATRLPESPSDQQKADVARNIAAQAFRTELQCRVDGAIQTVTVTSMRAPVMPSCTDRLGPSAVPVEARVWSGTDQSTIKNNPPAVLRGERETAYPQCATSACVVYVEHRGNPCLEGASACVAWTARLDVNPGDYKCRYGPYTLSITACYPLERLYETNGGTLPATEPNVDGNPSTVTQPQQQPATGTPTVPLTPTLPGPNPTGTANPNPGGTPGPAPAPNPDPLTNPGAPRPNPTGAPQPGTVTDPLAPGGAPGPGGDPLGDAGNARCWPNGWGWFNPAEWVARPIACAFVPGPETATRLASIGTELQQRPPYTFVAEANAVLGDLEGVEGTCYVRSASLPGIGNGQAVTVLDTCTPGPIEGAMMTYRPVLSAAIWIAVLSPLAWWAWKQYAPGAAGVA